MILALVLISRSLCFLNISIKSPTTTLWAWVLNFNPEDGSLTQPVHLHLPNKNAEGDVSVSKVKVYYFCCSSVVYIVSCFIQRAVRIARHAVPDYLLVFHMHGDEPHKDMLCNTSRTWGRPDWLMVPSVLFLAFLEGGLMVIFFQFSVPSLDHHKGQRAGPKWHWPGLSAVLKGSCLHSQILILLWWSYLPSDRWKPGITCIACIHTLVPIQDAFFIFIVIWALIWKCFGLVYIHISVTWFGTYKRESVWNPFCPTGMLFAPLVQTSNCCKCSDSSRIAPAFKQTTNRKKIRLFLWPVKESNHDFMYKRDEIWAKWNFHIIIGAKVIGLLQ